MSYHQFKDQNGEPFGSFQVYRYVPENNTSEWFLPEDDTCSKEHVIHIPRMYPFAGWYWREGFPGVFSDWEATGGPFETEQDAINDAIDGTFIPLTDQMTVHLIISEADQQAIVNALSFYNDMHMSDTSRLLVKGHAFPDPNQWRLAFKEDNRGNDCDGFVDMLATKIANSHKEHVYKVSLAINHLIDTINSVTPVATEDLRLTLHDLTNELIANLQLIDSVT